MRLRSRRNCSTLIVRGSHYYKNLPLTTYPAEPEPKRPFCRYGARTCEALFTILPGTSDRAQRQLAGEIALQEIARLKYEKQLAANIEAEVARKGFSFAEIVVRLNSAGELTRTGLPWSGPTVREAFNMTLGS